MNDDIPGSDLRLLREKFKTAKPSRERATVARRAKLEARRALSETDGRRKPSHEIRDTQLNMKVTSAMKRRAVDAARALGIPMVDVFERGLALVENEIAKGKKG